MADPYSAWVAEGDHWIAQNATYNLTMYNSTGVHYHNATSTTLDVLNQAAGASGSGASTNNGAGGSGAGGTQVLQNYSVSLNQNITLYVGAKGLGVARDTKGNRGENSTFDGNIAVGGGPGAMPAGDGDNGGSSGGAANTQVSGSDHIGGANTPGQGQRGGNSTYRPGVYSPGAGGGGNKTAGGSVDPNVDPDGGDGGDGFDAQDFGLSEKIACGSPGGARDGLPGVAVCGGGNSSASTSGATASAATSPGSAGGSGAAYFAGAMGTGKDGADGIIIVRLRRTIPTSSFISNKTAGISPLPVMFTDTSTGYPNIWVWSVDGTEIQNSSTIKNFAYTFNTQGTYTVRLDVWNTSLATTPSISTQNISVYSTTYSNFTISKINPVIFEDTISFTPTGPLAADRYLWNFGDGNTYLDSSGSAVTHKYESSSSNMTLHPSLTAYSSTNLSVTNTTILTISPVFNASYIEAGFIGSPTSGSAGLNVLFTDTSISGSGSAGLTCNWSFGDDAYSITPYSNVCGDTNHVYGYLGIYTVKLTISNALNTSTLTRSNYIIISNNQQMQTTFYSPHQVAFQVIDSTGNPIANTPISVHAIQSTLPGGLSGALTTLQNAYGVPLETAIEMLSNTTEYSGTTDTYGYSVVLMLSTIKYQVNVTDTTGVIQATEIMPQDSYYQIRTFNSTSADIFQQAVASRDAYSGESVYNASFYEPNSSYGTMINYVYDASGDTTGANCWFILVDNGTTWWENRTWSAGSGMQTFSMTIPIVPYQQWKWGCTTTS